MVLGLALEQGRVSCRASEVPAENLQQQRSPTRVCFLIVVCKLLYKGRVIPEGAGIVRN